MPMIDKGLYHELNFFEYFIHVYAIFSIGQDNSQLCVLRTPMSLETRTNNFFELSLVQSPIAIDDFFLTED